MEYLFYSLAFTVGCIIILEPTIKRVGGIVFWRVGRVGGSFYLSRGAK